MEIEDLRHLIRDEIAKSRYNWTRALTRKPEVMATVMGMTSNYPPDVPVADRLYAVLSDTGPRCPRGQWRRLDNVVNGWKGCGKANVCECTRARLSASNKETKRGKRIKAEAHASEATPSGNEEERLRAIIATTPAKIISQKVMNDSAIMAWIKQRSGATACSPRSVAEMIYVSLHGDGDAVCAYGRKKTFNTLSKGYRFCGHACQCRREEQSRKIMLHHRDLSDAERRRRLEKGRKTLEERYGVENAMHVADAREQQAATNLERHGVSHPMKSATDVPRAKIRATVKAAGKPTDV